MALILRIWGTSTSWNVVINRKITGIFFLKKLSILCVCFFKFSHFWFFRTQIYRFPFSSILCTWRTEQMTNKTQPRCRNNSSLHVSHSTQSFISYLSLRCLAFTWVIWPLEKSNTSSLSSLRMIMLFWQRLSLVRLAPTISLMKVGQCLGHSCFRI